ncbi:hypothetical protein SARC_16545 [Sphaeroforma arctica JP610]|uniref:LITAF domain-containing protein n=1 Tax=Sphaeroforma arctica JP610 TaxID=667725 RepID=A0A0L0F2T8_9EUKA|nr:hypothetical protein SARC_16545 [Sphaeroforma arctica JP610]KNC70924.1 hypothetical protein SARC_16545 [Sphaeroforma arctica JP610]|eukprot:XP_014144826.1 hypothetical protein SARC_16545 [Sphaeroforma arctica JP610]
MTDYSKAQENSQGAYMAAPPPTYSGANSPHPTAPVHGPYPTTSAMAPPVNQPIQYSEEKQPKYNYQQQPQPQLYQQGPLPANSYKQLPSVNQQPQPVAITSKPGFKSQCLYCPNCQKNCITRTEFENGAFSWGSAFFCCILGCWLGCCCVPLVMDSCKDVTHYCSECRAPITHRSRL